MRNTFPICCWKDLEHRGKIRGARWRPRIGSPMRKNIRIGSLGQRCSRTMSWQSNQLSTNLRQANASLLQSFPIIKCWQGVYYICIIFSKVPLRNLRMSSWGWALNYKPSSAMLSSQLANLVGSQTQNKCFVVVPVVWFWGFAFFCDEV